MAKISYWGRDLPALKPLFDGFLFVRVSIHGRLWVSHELLRDGARELAVAETFAVMVAVRKWTRTSNRQTLGFSNFGPTVLPWQNNTVPDISWH